MNEKKQNFLKNPPILIGALHLPPFINSELKAQNLNYEKIESYVIKNAKKFQEGGFDGIYIQDQTPGNKTSLQTVAWTSALARVAKRAAPEIEIGIVIQSDDPEAAINIASAAGGSFVRIKVFVGAMVKSYGIIEGSAGKAVKTRSDLYSNINLLTDIYDRTGDPLGDIPLEKAIQQAVVNGSNGIILTGKNYEQTLQYIKKGSKVVDNSLPVFVGGGVTHDNINELLEFADGVIVSSALKKDSGEGWDLDKIKEMVEKVKPTTPPKS